MPVLCNRLFLKQNIFIEPMQVFYLHTLSFVRTVNQHALTYIAEFSITYLTGVAISATQNYFLCGYLRIYATLLPMPWCAYLIYIVTKGIAYHSYSQYAQNN